MRESKERVKNYKEVSELEELAKNPKSLGDIYAIEVRNSTDGIMDLVYSLSKCIDKLPRPRSNKYITKLNKLKRFR